MSYNWRLHDSGSGPAMLLLHAFPFDARMWDAPLKALAASHRVIAPDMPGFGGAPPWLGRPDLDSWASSLLDQLRAQGVAEAIVAGCSLGGYLAFAMLRTASNFIRGLALVDTRAIADTPGRKVARSDDAPLGHQSQSRTHGGFDVEPDTLASVLEILSSGFVGMPPSGRRSCLTWG